MTTLDQLLPLVCLALFCAGVILVARRGRSQGRAPAAAPSASPSARSAVRPSTPGDESGDELPSEERLQEQLARYEAAGDAGRAAVTLRDLSLVHFRQQRFAAAEDALRRGVGLIVGRFGERSPEALVFRDHLAEFLQATGQLHESAIEAERALALAEELPEGARESPPVLAQRLLRQGKALHQQGLLLKAEALLRRALTLPLRDTALPAAMSDSQPEPEPGLRQQAQLLLAECLINQGRLAEAEVLYDQALAEARRLTGARHPETAARLRDRAGLYRLQGRLGDAAADLRQAEELLAAAGGAHQLALVQLKESLAVVLCEAGQMREAEEPLRAALAINEAVFGPQHAQVAAALGNLGELYQVSGRYEEAEPLLRRALAQREQALGADHVFLVPYLTRLARLLLEQGRYHEAQELQRRVLSLREQALGPDHPGLVATLDELIDTQRRGGDLAQTEQWIERTLRIRKKFLGEDHPEHGHRLVGLAMTRAVLGQSRQAELTYLAALSALEKAHGENHPGLLPVLTALGGHHFAHDDLGRAEALARRALGIAADSLGAAHMTTLQCRENLAAVLEKLGRTDDALEERRRIAVARDPAPSFGISVGPKLVN